MKMHVCLLLLLTMAGIGLAQENDTNSNQSNPAKAKQLAARQEAESRIATWIANQDQDNDGKISRDESTGLMKTNFTRIDTNRNDVIERAELAALAKRLIGNQNRRTQSAITDDQLLQRAPDGVEMELNIAYREGNKAWRLDLAMPKQKSETPRPAIVFVHGGGWTKGDKRSNLFIGQAMDFAAQGYVCVSVNYRLDSKKLPCIEDVKCAVRWLRANAKKYNLDPNRIGAYGNSAGAHLVVMLGISGSEKKLEGDGPFQEFSSNVQAVAASATPTRPNLRNGTDEARKLISPMTYVTGDAPPMLLFHEASDPVVDVSNSDNFVKALQEAGAKNIQYKRYTDGSGHGVFGKNLKETQRAMEKFFENTIGVKGK